MPGSGCIRRWSPATVSAARLAEYAHRSPRTCIVSPDSSATDTGGSQSSGGGGGGAGAAWAASPPLLLTASRCTASPELQRAFSGTGGRASNGADCCQLAAAAGADGVNLGSGLGPAEGFSSGKRSDVPKQPRDDLDDDDNELRRSPSPSRFISDSAEGTDFPSLSMWLWLIWPVNSPTKSWSARRRRAELVKGV